MFKEIGIKGRVLLLSLLPSSLLALGLGGYYTWTQLSDLQTQLQQRGQMIATQLATLAAPALQNNDAQLLERIADEGLEQPDARSDAGARCATRPARPCRPEHAQPRAQQQQ